MGKKEKELTREEVRKMTADQTDDFVQEFVDLDEEEVTEADKAIQKHRKKKKAGIAVLIILVLLAAAYVGMSVFFQSHFFFFSKINGVDCSAKSVKDIEEQMAAEVADYELKIVGSDGVAEFIDGDDISAVYQESDELNEILKSQNPYMWIESLWKNPEYETSIGVSYDETALKKVVKSLSCMDEEKMTASVNAHPEFEDTKFVVVDEVIGTQINEDKMYQAVGDAVSSFQKELFLRDAGVYKDPKYTSESPEVQEACDKMNSYLGAEITYELDPDTEVVGSAKIAEWIVCNKKNLKVKFKEELVKEYIADLAKRVDTVGKDRKFTTATGKEVTVEGGDFGWRINQDEEYETLLSNIKKGEVITREPVYSRKAVSHGSIDIGKTYAEVDLTKQHMYFIKDGKVVLESDIVTGNPNRGNATPQGTYSLTYKDRNATLRGDRLPDGSYSYETPVAYWMPFNGGIGFHDATWQSSFGGEGYKSHGSHGCVNMPKDKAAALYDLIPDHCPVVCHY